MNNKLQTFSQFLANQNIQISIVDFLINIIITAILVFLIQFFYIKFSSSLSNRKKFSYNLILLGLITMIIISVVKSSLALSLGLVGALSIVRFRTAIKEPEELIYLFLTIAVGLGLGASLRLLTIIGTAIIFIIIIILHFFKKKDIDNNFILTISSNEKNKIELNDIINILKKYCNVINMKRLDDVNEILEINLQVIFENFNKFQECQQELKKYNKDINITFLDNIGL